MSDDFVWPNISISPTLAQRLRIRHCTQDTETACGECLPCEAAAKLEELEAEIPEYQELDKVRLAQLRNATGEMTRLQERIKFLVAVGDQLRNTINYLYVRQAATEDVVDLLDTWEEARNE